MTPFLNMTIGRREIVKGLLLLVLVNLGCGPALSADQNTAALAQAASADIRMPAGTGQGCGDFLAQMGKKPGPAPIASVILIHGGGWFHGDKTKDQDLATLIAAQGIFGLPFVRMAYGLSYCGQNSCSHRAVNLTE